MALSSKQIEELKKTILEKINTIQNHFYSETSKLDINSEEEKDEVDQANGDNEREQLLKLHKRESIYLRELNQALEKIENNEYGFCEECGEDIKFARLRARPSALMCVSCQDDYERTQGSLVHAHREDTFQSFRQESHERPLSLV